MAKTFTWIFYHTYTNTHTHTYTQHTNKPATTVFEKLQKDYLLDFNNYSPDYGDTFRGDEWTDCNWATAVVSLHLLQLKTVVVLSLYSTLRCFPIAVIASLSLLCTLYYVVVKMWRCWFRFSLFSFQFFTIINWLLMILLLCYSLSLDFSFVLLQKNGDKKPNSKQKINNFNYF